MSEYTADIEKYASNVDEDVVETIRKYCGIALQNRDSSLVSTSDKDTPHLKPVTSRPEADEECHTHEIFVPAGALVPTLDKGGNLIDEGHGNGRLLIYLFRQAHSS